MAEESREDYDDPAVEDRWLQEQQRIVLDYLLREKVVRPNDLKCQWFLVPYVSLWAGGIPDSARLWIISGDLPTDYERMADSSTAREAMAAFAARWGAAALLMSEGKTPPEFHIGNTKNVGEQKMLADLLCRRASLFTEWVADDSFWHAD